MADAVIVSTARTPIGRAYRGAFNNTHGATLGGHVIQHAVQRAGLEPGQVEDVILGCALPGRRDRTQHRAGVGTPGRAAGHDGRRHREPLLLLGPAGDRHGRAARDRRSGAGHGRGRAGVHQPRAERAHEPAPLPRVVDGRPQARDLHVDDRDGRGRLQALLRHAGDAGRVCAGQPAAHRGRPARGPLRPGDRPAAHHEADRRQGQRRDARGAGHAQAGRGQSGRHQRRRSRRASSRSRARRA